MSHENRAERDARNGQTASEASRDDRRGASSLEDAFEEPAFVPYLAAGDPDFESSL
ncbi:MAG: hypothetical protein ACI9TI_000106, partial [Natronomonas sp.]